jgi:TonB family protein
MKSNQLLIGILFILSSISGWSQIKSIEEAALSPDGHKIALLCQLNDVDKDLLVYDLQKDTLIRLTFSNGLTYDQQYKISPNWVNDYQIIFLSRHNGLVQEYLLDILQNKLIPNGSSPSNEYYLQYAPTSQTSYYISTINGHEPAVYSRKLNDTKIIQISKGNINYSFPKISQDGNFISYNEMPFIKAHLFSLVENKEISIKLPSSNTRICCWSPDSQSFLYRHSFFPNNETEPNAIISLYSLATKKDSLIIKNSYVTTPTWSHNNTLFGYLLPGKFVLINKDLGTQKVYAVTGHVINVIWSLDNNAVFLIENTNIQKLNLLDGGITWLNISGASSSEKSYCISEQYPLSHKQIKEMNYQEVILRSPYLSDSIHVDKYPMYPAGENGLKQDVLSLLKYPLHAQQNKIQGKVVVKFTIGLDGTCQNLQVIQSVCKELDEAAIQLIKSLRLWLPACKNNTPITIDYAFPINYRIE